MHLTLTLRHICTFALLMSLAHGQDEVTTSAPTIINNSGSTTTSTTADTATATSASAAEASAEVPGTPKSAAAASAKKYFTAADLPVCKIGSPNFNDCVRNLLQESLIRIKNGDRDLNIPVIDPFRLNRTSFQYSNTILQGRIVMRDGLTYGFSKAQIKKVDLQVKDDRIKMTALSFVPEIKIVGNYKGDFKFNNAQIRANGQFNVTLVDVYLDQIYEGSFYEADGHRFVRMDKFDAEPKVGDFKISATGIFPDPTLNELALNIVNQYWRQIFQIFLPETRKYWGPMLLRQINEIMSVVPYDVFVVD